MPLTIPTHFVQQYVSNLEMLLQQKGGKLTDKVARGSYYGKSVKFIEQFGPIVPSRNLPRGADTPLSNPTDDARWLQPIDYDAGILIDNQDKLRMLIDPKSGYLINMVEGMRRAQDDEILCAFTRSSLTGQDGTTTTPLLAANVISVSTGGSNSGMNVAKLRAMKKLFMKNGVNLDSETIWCILDSQAHDDLLNEIEVINLDYNTKPTLVDGKVTQFMGINFQHVEFQSAADYPLANTGWTNSGGTSLAGALIDSSSNILYPCWSTLGMHYGDWNMLETDIGPRRDKRNAQQIYVTQTIGASRVQEKRVGYITCYPGA